MKVLLDTVTFLDAAFSSKDLLLHADTNCTSAWLRVGKLRSNTRSAGWLYPRTRISSSLFSKKLGADMLPLDEESAFHVTRLPNIHRDPFDRILICQAIIHGMVLLTPDHRISRYPVRTAW